MFVGHFAIAFAGKRVAPRMSLGTLLFGAQFLDLIWPALVLLGVEVTYRRGFAISRTPGLFHRTGHWCLFRLLACMLPDYVSFNILQGMLRRVSPSHLCPEIITVPWHRLFDVS
jgi:hypothetical protein